MFEWGGKRGSEVCTQEVYGVRFFEDMNKIEVIIAHEVSLGSESITHLSSTLFATARPPFTIKSESANNIDGARVVPWWFDIICPE